MRVPLSWLGESVALPPGVSGRQVVTDLARIGLEEEAVHGGELTGPLVVGRVLDVTPEPQKNGRTIRWCHVDVGPHNPPGGTSRGIVCGADNFAVGDLVVVALPGSVLPGGFAISARKTYGHVSDGMICSVKELGIGDDHEGILRLVEIGLGESEVGADAITLLGLDEQTVEVNVTPDRGYALSVRGVAREYSHATGARFTDPADVEVPPAAPDGFTVVLADRGPLRGRPGCDRFAARVVRGVDASAPSPAWLRRRLDQAGMRPISLAVDVTNYVMLAVGQPLHAFDLATLTAPIVVRRAAAGERLTTLDGADRALDPEDLVVADSVGGSGTRAVALAGVMGGADTEVSEGTTDLLLEAAHWDPVSVSRTARRHRLGSEAARRFERGVDDDLGPRAIELAVRLLVEHGGGEPGPVTDTDERVRPAPVRMPVDLPTRVVGVAYSPEEVAATLVAIGCSVDRAGDDLVVTVPTWRPDLRAGIDLVEEVARLRGYDRIPSVVPAPPPGRGYTTAQRLRRSVARTLADEGLVEVLSYPFVSPGVHDALRLPADDPRRRAVRLRNPLSDEQPEMRTSLLPPLLDTLRRNVSRGAVDVGLFEIGLVVRPTEHGSPAPVPPVGRRPADDELAALAAAVPPQPRRLAAVLTGDRDLPGWDSAGRAADWTDAVAAAHAVAGTLGLRLDVVQDEHAPWHPGRGARLELAGELVGHAGELDPRVLTGLGLPARTVAVELDLDRLVAAAPEIRRAAPLSTFPLAKEDVALVVDDSVPVAAVEAALRAGAGDLLESLRLFDVYTGEQVGRGRRSLAFALRFRAPDRTLTAAELVEARSAALAVAAERTGAVLRGG
ncbi:MAG: phenylalanine--tRNA ligase subunit beta [Kineosporiaceae bacterium]